MLLFVGPSTRRSGGVATWFRLVLGALDGSARSDRTAVQHFVTDKRSAGRGPLPARVVDGGLVARDLRAALRDHRPDGVHIACGSGWSFREAAVHAALARRAGSRVVIHLHAASLERWWGTSRAERPLIRRVLGAADRVAVLSPGVRSWLTARGVPPERLAVIPNGVPLGPSRPTPTPPPPLRLLVVGSVEARKGVHDLVRALDRVRGDVEVTWIGPGDPVPARALRFAGRQPPGAVQEALDGAHGLLMPSRREGLPFALLEAMARGVPVLGTRVGAIPELLADGAGVLVPPARPDALAEAIQRWIDDPEALGGLGDRGRARVAAHHTLDHTLDAVRSVWADLGVLL